MSERHQEMKSENRKMLMSLQKPELFHLYPCALFIHPSEIYRILGSSSDVKTTCWEHFLFGLEVSCMGIYYIIVEKSN
jgi:hypothetical protein